MNEILYIEKMIDRYNLKNKILIFVYWIRERTFVVGLGLWYTCCPNKWILTACKRIYGLYPCL